MHSSDKLAHPEDPLEKVNLILAEILGAEADLLSEKGRNEALERLDERAGEEGDTETDLEIFEEVPPDDTRTAWEVARSLCANVQLKTALELLEKLKSLPERDDVNMEYAQPEDFNGLKRQIRAELVGLRDELSGDADVGALENIFSTLGEPLFERLRSAGNFFDEYVVTRSDERAVIDYLAICALVAEICEFPISCGRPAREPEGLGTRVGKSLGTLAGCIHCIGEVAKDIREELGSMGVSEGCSPVSIPGVKFDAGPVHEPSDQDSKTEAGQRRKPQSVQEEPPTEDLFALLRRCESAVGPWLEKVEQNGKDGAANIRSEVDRLSMKAGRFRPKVSGRQSANYEPPKIIYLLNVFVTEFEEASKAISDLLSS